MKDVRKKQEGKVRIWNVLSPGTDAMCKRGWSRKTKMYKKEATKKEIKMENPGSGLHKYTGYLTTHY
jgi:hypothetical protein